MSGVRSSIADGGWRSFGGVGVGGSRFAGAGIGRGFGGYGLGFRGRGFGGCWGCGFGFGLGFGWGWGWPYWGFDWGWPYWDLGFGWGYPGWGYPYWDGYWGPEAYPPDYGYDDYNGNAGNYSDYGGDTNDYSGNYSDNSVYSNAPDDSTQAPEGAGASQSNSTTMADPESIPTVVYLKDGTSFQITSYWSSGSTLHYVDSQGGVSSIDASQIDLQRTVSENAKHGIRFPIKPQPSTATPSAPAASSTPTVQTTSLSKAA